MKNTKNNNLPFIIETAVIISLITFFLTYTTSYIWLRDGFDLMEASFLSILTSAFFFGCFLVIGIWKLNSFKSFCLKNNIKPFNKYILVSLILLFSLFFYVLLDTFIFYFVDRSIPEAFADSLSKLAESSDKKLRGIEDFRAMPFSLQNIVVNFIALFLAGLISLPFIKKDGKLFKTLASDYR